MSINCLLVFILLDWSAGLNEFSSRYTKSNNNTDSWYQFLELVGLIMLVDKINIGNIHPRILIASDILLLYIL